MALRSEDGREYLFRTRGPCERGCNSSKDDEHLSVGFVFCLFYNPKWLCEDFANCADIERSVKPLELSVLLLLKTVHTLLLNVLRLRAVLKLVYGSVRYRAKITGKEKLVSVNLNISPKFGMVE